MVKYIKDRANQLGTVKSCHVDPTSGHLGVRKTVGRIRERFMWKGVWNDVKKMVRKFIKVLCRNSDDLNQGINC